MVTETRGRDLRAARYECGITQKALAEELEIEPRILGFIENERIPLDEEFAQQYHAAVQRMDEGTDAGRTRQAPGAA